jgi:hypothetical protein
MVVDVFQSSLLVHEQRMKGQKEEEQVLNVSYGGRGGRGRGGRGKKLNKETIEWYKCCELGHFLSYGARN